MPHILPPGQGGAAHVACQIAGRSPTEPHLPAEGEGAAVHAVVEALQGRRRFAGRQQAGGEVLGFVTPTTPASPAGQSAVALTQMRGPGCVSRTTWPVSQETRPSARRTLDVPSPTTPISKVAQSQSVDAGAS
jgi:hypothetical protein